MLPPCSMRCMRSDRDRIAVCSCYLVFHTHTIYIAVLIFAPELDTRNTLLASRAVHTECSGCDHVWPLGLLVNCTFENMFCHTCQLLIKYTWSLLLRREMAGLLSLVLLPPLAQTIQLCISAKVLEHGDTLLFPAKHHVLYDVLHATERNQDRS